MHNFEKFSKYYRQEESIMKKIALMFICMLLVVGCSCSLMNADTPTKKTEKFLDKYKNLDDDVISDLNDSVAAENLNDENKGIYESVLKRQYQDLKYKVTDEKVEGDEATVTVNITVYDLYKVGKEADDYLVDNQDEFLTNDAYDNNKFMKYKLNKMKDTEETVDYTIKIYSSKVDGEWVVQEPDAEVKEKIHGLYDYED